MGCSPRRVSATTLTTGRAGPAAATVRVRVQLLTALTWGRRRIRPDMVRTGTAELNPPSLLPLGMRLWRALKTVRGQSLLRLSQPPTSLARRSDRRESGSRPGPVVPGRACRVRFCPGAANPGQRFRVRERRPTTHWTEEPAEAD